VTAVSDSAAVSTCFVYQFPSRVTADRLRPADIWCCACMRTWHPHFVCCVGPGADLITCALSIACERGPQCGIDDTGVN
jgi:hypothetical protein